MRFLRNIKNSLSNIFFYIEKKQKTSEKGKEQ